MTSRIFRVLPDKKTWMQYIHIDDRSVTIVDYTKALLYGWNPSRSMVQGAEDWPDMSRDEIVAWKFQHGWHPDTLIGLTVEELHGMDHESAIASLERWNAKLAAERVQS
jgi:hypothetical protein